MQPPKFTEQAQEVLAASQEIVRRYRHSQWDVEHILLALLEQEGGVTAEILEELGVDIEPVRGKVEQALTRTPPVAYEGKQIYPTPRIEGVFRAAASEAERFNDEFIGSEHLFIAIAGEWGGESAKILKEFGIDEEKIYGALQKIRGGQRITDPRAESKYRALEKYSRDLTELAKQGKLDPVIGREEEIKRVMGARAGIVRAPWCGKEECGKAIEEKTNGSVLGEEPNQKRTKGNCSVCSKPAKTSILIARTY